MRQRGLTLIEMLVVMAVGGMVMAGVAPAVFQMMMGVTRNNESAVILNDIDRAAHWITRDLGLAQTTDLIAGFTVPQMTLTWSDLTNWAVVEGSVPHTATYCYNGLSTTPPCDAQSTSELRRSYDGVVTTVGSYLTDVGFSISSDGKFITVTLTSSLDSAVSPARSETRTYVIYLRTEGGL